MNGLAVVDASLAVKWLVNESDSERSCAVARSWADNGTRPVSPNLMPVEAANALYRRVVRHELTVAEAARLLGALMASGIELREDPRLHGRAMEMAEELGQDAVYDTHYLALAEILQCECWTADQRFHRVASQTFKFVRWLGEAF